MTLEEAKKETEYVEDDEARNHFLWTISEVERLQVQLKKSSEENQRLQARAAELEQCVKNFDLALPPGCTCRSAWGHPCSVCVARETGRRTLSSDCSALLAYVEACEKFVQALEDEAKQYDTTGDHNTDESKERWMRMQSLKKACGR